MLYKNAARQIKLLRIKRGMTQKDLGVVLGVTSKYLSAVENNTKKASLYFYKEVADYFKVSLDYLFFESIQEKKNIYIDTVNLKMNYMEEAEQRLVMNFVDELGKYIEEKETKADKE